MCQVMLNVCDEGFKIHWVRMRYCEPVCDKYPKLPVEWTLIKIRDKLSWSPMDGCEGLTIESPVMINNCGSGAGWPSDQDMDDVFSLRDLSGEDLN